MALPELKELPVVTGRTIRKLLRCSAGTVNVSLDLGLTPSTVSVTEDSVELPDGFAVDREELDEAWRHPEDCVVLSEKGCIKAYLYSDERGKYYKLYQHEEGLAPTIVINNATMHSVVRMGPWEDEIRKVQALPEREGECLDTCCGLGYSAQLLAEAGFERVVTCEEDPNVLEIAAINPWSRDLFRRRRIDLHDCDMRDYMAECSDNSFPLIFHDPPTVYQAGELYSEELYREFARLLEPGGVLYHYVGEPGRNRGQDYAGGVLDRLHEAGFRSTERCHGGVLAIWRPPTGAGRRSG